MDEEGEAAEEELLCLPLAPPATQLPFCSACFEAAPAAESGAEEDEDEGGGEGAGGFLSF